MSRTVKLHVLCSIKGGVGKSTLAVACAKLIAARGGAPLLIDANPSGTSLADGLLLRAPKVALRGDGTLDLDAPPTGEHYSVQETERLRNTRKHALLGKHALPPAYLNDALSYVSAAANQECRIEGMLWAHERTDNVLYLPSSPLEQDVALSLGWIFSQDPFRWICRMTWLLEALLTRLPSLTDVVMDLPPGVWEGGFSHEALSLAAMLSQGEPLPEGYPDWEKAGIAWQVAPLLVTTPDWNDVLPALEYLAAHSADLPTLRILVNRAGGESSMDFRARVRRRLDPALAGVRLEEQIERVEDLGRSLGEVFRVGDLAVDGEVQSVGVPLGLENGR
ncbi:MAG TPA: hypothetical protein VLS89_04670 [Candidatus Nanopelagicales bacterium]|nr:hypothetical protein [Candidatus Nanopelagicales bacterium]